MTGRTYSSAFMAVCCVAAAVFQTACPTVPRRPVVQADPEADAAADAARRAQELVARGKLKEALKVYSDAYDRRRTAGLRNSYVRLCEQLRKSADAAYQDRDFAAAGGSYHALLKNGLAARDISSLLSFDAAYLETRINACSRSLMEAGLERYRRERLDEAVEIWEGVLAFDPENGEVQKALDTARTQLRQLKNVE
jgi:tetratricopeptide (TPR) repeat protein